MTEETFVGSLSAHLMYVEEQRNALKKKCQELEDTITARNEMIHKLRAVIQVEKFKTNLCSFLLAERADIKLDDILQETEDGLHVYNCENGNVPVFVHEYMSGKTDDENESKQYTIAVRKKVGTNKPLKNRKVYRTVKNQVELIEEKPQEQEEKIKKVDENFMDILQENNLDVSYKDIIHSIDKLFDDLVKTKVYGKILSAMCEIRSKLLGKLSLEQYIKILDQNVKKMEQLFRTKKMEDKKIPLTIVKSLSSLDQRLLFYEQYYNSELLPDDMQRLQISLQINTNYPKRYLPFVAKDLFEKMYNYGIAVFPLRETLKRVLVNPYGFFNIVYLDIPKSTEDDPYSFYFLEKFDMDGKRCWKMEIRLDEFSKTLAQNLRAYCIGLFRKIYLDIFHDNIYRDDYRDKAIIANQDCEQLLINIIALAKPKTFCDVLRNLVVKHCTIHPSHIDKFNFTADDRIHKKHFGQENDTQEELTSILCRIFDDLSEEDVIKITSRYIKDDP